jgi:hypothetical protein
MQNLTVTEALNQAKAGTLDGHELWYDWFCRDTSLPGKTKVLMGKLKTLAKSGLFNPDTTTFFFKNNCPMCGSLYDSISFKNPENNDVILWFTPSSGHENKKGIANLDNVSGKEVSLPWKEMKQKLKSPDFVASFLNNIL